MIVKMNKITILVSDKNREDALNKLRKLGIIHIHYLKDPVSEDTAIIEGEIVDLDKALALLGTSEEQKGDVNKTKIRSYIKEIISLNQEKNALLKELEEKKENIKWFKIWGDISHSSILELNDVRVFIRLYTCNKKQLKRLAVDKMIHIVKIDKKTVYLALFSTSKDDSLDFTEHQVPKVGLADLEKRIAEINKDIKYIDKRLNKLAKFKDCFIHYKKDLIQNLEFNKVKNSMAGEENFCYLEGFCPVESISKIKDTSLKEGWAYLAKEPDNPDEVPTLIKNPEWLKIIEPVFKFMGTLPGYTENDVSFYFLIFFSIFFAMLIGDAGYGLIFLSITYFTRRKFKHLPREPFVLAYVLSIATITWGTVTGTWLGVEKIAQMPIFNSFVIDKINSFVDANQLFMIYLCFVIGVIHLTIAHGIIAFKFMNSLVALSQIGWICVMWGLFFVAGKLVLAKPLPGFFGILFTSGFVLIVVFSNPKISIKGMLLTFADLPLTIISSFSDVVSYLRLFAVGYATVVVATSFNNLAVGEGINGLFSGLAAALILFFGHALNIILGLMAVVVHGIRLNMLEFSGHLNMQWSGREYLPFKE